MGLTVVRGDGIFSASSIVGTPGARVLACAARISAWIASRDFSFASLPGSFPSLRFRACFRIRQVIVHPTTNWPYIPPAAWFETVHMYQYVPA